MQHETTGKTDELRLRRRARAFCRGTRLSADGVEALLRRAKSCGYCQKPIDPLVKPRHPKALQIDHKLPKGRGGTNAIRNLHTVCKGCNRAKGSLLDSEYRALRAFLKGWPEMETRVLRRLAASKAFF